MPRAPPRAALADDSRNGWHPQVHHFTQVDRDGFGNVAFFRANARISAGRIDERNHRQIKFLAELHQAQRFAITFRMRAPEIAHHIFLGVAALLIRDHDATLLPQHRNPAWHGLVVAKQTVAVQLVPIRKAHAPT